MLRPRDTGRVALLLGTLASLLASHFATSMHARAQAERLLVTSDETPSGDVQPSLELEPVALVIESQARGLSNADLRRAIVERVDWNFAALGIAGDAGSPHLLVLTVGEDQSVSGALISVGNALEVDDHESLRASATSAPSLVDGAEGLTRDSADATEQQTNSAYTRVFRFSKEGHTHPVSATRLADSIVAMLQVLDQPRRAEVAALELLRVHRFPDLLPWPEAELASASLGHTFAPGLVPWEPRRRSSHTAVEAADALSPPPRLERFGSPF